jgi:nickel transport protein
MTARSDLPRGLAVAALIAVAAPVPALGHAALVQGRAVAAVEVLARFDTGDPMAEAQVIVFAPDDPASPWLRGTTDAEGRFLFVADPGRPGRWTAQVRQAGHGAIVHLDLGGEAAVADGAPSGEAPGRPGPMQRLVMVALVAWGALGTALFFRRRPARDASA